MKFRRKFKSQERHTFGIFAKNPDFLWIQEFCKKCHFWHCLSLIFQSGQATISLIDKELLLFYHFVQKAKLYYHITKTKWFWRNRCIINNFYQKEFAKSTQWQWHVYKGYGSRKSERLAGIKFGSSHAVPNTLNLIFIILSSH